MPFVPPGRTLKCERYLHGGSFWYHPVPAKNSFGHCSVEPWNPWTWELLQTGQCACEYRLKTKQFALCKSLGMNMDRKER
jgi:hypothetical protein